MKKLIYLIPYVGYKYYLKNLKYTNNLYYDNLITLYNGACIGFLVAYPIMKLIDLLLLTL